MNEEQAKRESRTTTTTTTPFIQLGQVDSDFALALSLQEQERAFTMLPTVESDREENEEGTASEEEDDQNEDYFDEDDAAFFLSQDIDAELAFSEGEDSNDYQMEEMEEDDVDPDELSYEELIALGEIVGEENRGLSAEEISSCLSPYTCLSVDSKTTIDRCVICQVEYEEGEKLVALPCEHPYHSDCDATKALGATNGTTLEKNGQILRVAYAKSILGPGSGPSRSSQSSSLAAAAIEAAAFAQQYDAVGWAPKEYNPDNKQPSGGQEPSGGEVAGPKDAYSLQSGFVWDEASGYYYDASSGFYYDGNTGLYYDGNNGVWYSYDHQTQ